MAIVLAALAAAPALAAEPADHAGAYWLGGVSEGDESCDVTLGSEPVIGGWSLKLAADCQEKLGVSPDIAAWTTGGGGQIRFIDALRKPLLVFEPVEIGGFVAQPDGGEPLSLDRAVNGPEPTEQERMSGPWVVTRMGGDIQCRYASTANKAGSKGTLIPGADCPAPWSRISRWEVAKGRVTLFDKAGKVVVVLPGDSIQGFDGDDAKGEFLGFTRDWTD
ncbi:MAG: AprI/Inh family metalloprotease inhibitor [Caulobacter sp.]|nr:AprI/Inh family metalloprotease inhibitor [Caulobacter sp.]